MVSTTASEQLKDRGAERSARFTCVVSDAPLRDDPEPQTVTIATPKPRLLLVEDDPSTANALRSIFTRRGWDVETGSTVHDALALLEPVPNSVILDLGLPDGDGLEVLKAIRDKGLSVRVAVTTGVSDSARLKVVADLEPDIVLSKPVDLPELLEILGIADNRTEISE